MKRSLLERFEQMYHVQIFVHGKVDQSVSQKPKNGVKSGDILVWTIRRSSQ